MSRPITVAEELVSILRESQKERREVQAELDDVQEKHRKTIAQFEDLRSRRETLRQQQAEELTEQVCAGNSDFSLDPVRAKEIREIGDKLSAMPETLARLEQRLSDATALARTKQVAVQRAWVKSLLANRDCAASAIRAALEQIAPHLVTLIAVDAVRRTIPVQDLNLQAGDVVGDFSGEFVAQKLIAGVSQLLRPADLDEEVLAARIAERSAEIQAIFGDVP